MKRLISLGLVLILLISMLALPVFAEAGADEGDGTSQGEGTGNPGGSGEGTGNPGGSGEGTGNPGGSGEGTGNPGGSGEGTGNPGGSGEGTGNPGGSGEGTSNPGGSGEGTGNPGGSGEGTGNPGGSGEGTGNPGGSGEGTGNPGGSGEGSGNTGDGSGEGSDCKHEWIYVEVEPTCTEYGAKGYYCTKCEGVADVVAVPPAHTYAYACDADCDVCGATREVTHSFSTQWSKNSRKHWHACKVCGVEDELSDHYPGPAATEEKAQYCLTCGLQMMPKKSHTHDYATALTGDATGHWYACSGCDEKKDFASHTYDDLCDPDCNDCGFTSETAHSFAEDWESDENGHWSVCSLCGELKPSENHIPGAEPTDTEAQLCTVCGFELMPALVHVHEAGTMWQSDHASHWHSCECGEKMDQADHTWDEGVENEDTTITYVCTACQAEKTEGEPKTASEFPVWILFLGIAILCGIAALVLILVMVIKNKPGKYNN